jgi:hypothetical protein
MNLQIARAMGRISVFDPVEPPKPPISRKAKAALLRIWQM